MEVAFHKEACSRFANASEREAVITATRHGPSEATSRL